MAETQTTIVYQKMKEKIEKGEYSPAQSLPEAALAKEYGVSRNTIKKVLLMLENDAYVTMDLNKGARVSSYSKEEVLQFLELREVLEGFIIRQAIPCITEENLKTLKGILSEMKEDLASGNLLHYSSGNHRFHQIIYDACPNHPAVEMTLRLKNQMKKYNSKTILVPKRGEHSFAEHSAIYEAIANRDPEQGEKLIKEHIHNVRNTFDEYYSILF